MHAIEASVRLFVGGVVVGAICTMLMAALIVLLPWRVARIRATNIAGTMMGRSVMWFSGSRVKIYGWEAAQEARPAIYAGNHTSIFDAFTSIWLTPPYTVGVAKREILYYPFYGLAWLLAGHPILDRSRRDRAIRTMKALANFCRKNRLSICMWPEGTRSRDGRLRPFKKGIVHLAISTGLPIVPMITVGAQNAWKRGTLLNLRAKDITIQFLPPIDTSDWTVERLEEHLAELERVFANALPEPMRPAAIPSRV